MISDEESVYRRVRKSTGAGDLCFEIENNKVKFRHAAFNDPTKKPSIERAILKCQRNPNLTRLGAEDGIVSLQVEQIRRIGPIVKNDEKGNPTVSKFSPDVMADPTLLNCAHALIVLSPEKYNETTFKKLKTSLARLATEKEIAWEVKPNSPMPRLYFCKLYDALKSILYFVRARVTQLVSPLGAKLKR